MGPERGTADAGGRREQYDFIIIGGGSAGCALASRLSADPASRVLVLEAGRPDYRWDVFIHMPAALTIPIGNKFYDWRYESEPEPHMGGRRIYHARGKVLGGSSSINGMIFQRGNPLDYQRWAADPGMAAWDYAHCLPYFKRMENCLAGGDEFRGSDGPLVLERGPATNPLFRAFFEAVQQAGYPLTDDVNGYRQEGFAAFDRNVHRGRRLSAARAYLHPVLGRANLDVITRAFVTKILFSGKRATGVEFRRGNAAVRQASAGEIILCGGAINSPQLLELSGVGDAGLLSSLGIDVVADLPGAVTTDQQIRDWVARDGETALHPSCTCAMGTGGQSVVDPSTMRVHGLDGLRVVDASVMPYITNGNIYAPVMMIAEKSADLILGNTPLPPAAVEFYRHDRAQSAGADGGGQPQQ